MTNKFERILLSILLGTSVLLGLSFWLNIIYGFNLFYEKHWAELARLQAEHIPISTGFYISIGIAILIFTFGILFIYVPIFKSKVKNQKEHPQLITKQTVTNTAPIEPEPINDAPIILPMARPPRLNLPKNMAQIIAQKQQQQPQPQNNNTGQSVTPYNAMLAEIFTEYGYTIKPNVKISEFMPNLFAIAPNEILWIGAVDQDITKLQPAIERLQSLFQETLEDIPININAFILDTMNNQQPNDSILIFKSIEDLKDHMSKLPPVSIDDADNLDKSNFDAYSEYIDTIMQYLKTAG